MILAVNVAVNVAVMDDGRVLLMKREDFEVWCLPGGQVDPGESLAGAAVREVREEAGVDVVLVGLVGTYSRPNWHDGMYIVLFEARPTGGALRADPHEVVEAGWFSRDALPTPLLHGQRVRLEDAFAHRRGVARSNLVRSPFTDRAEAYQRRDESALDRAAFYDFHIRSLADDDELEISMDEEGLAERPTFPGCRRSS